MSEQDRYRFSRDAAIITVALGLLIYEVMFGGARPSALTAITSLLLSPLVLHIDEARRDRKDK